MAPDKRSTYVKAQRILQKQLLDKQNHLYNVILNQKAQLTKIQEQIIVNAQAQFSLYEIDDLESTKELRQQVNDLEVERKQHETRQQELNAVFVQTLDVKSAHRNDGQMHAGRMATSNIAYPQNVRSQPLQHVANTAHSSGTSQNPANSSSSSYHGLHYSNSSDATGNISVNIPQKARAGRPNGSCEFDSKGCLQDAERSSLNEGFEEDLFSGVLQPNRRQSSLSGHYAPVVQTNNSHYKSSSVPSLVRSDDFSYNELNGVNTDSSGPSGTQAKDYFSKFSASELETFLSSPSFPATVPTQSDNNTHDDNVCKEETESPSTYDSLLLQQKRLLEMQEEQRRQLVRRQQAQLLRLQEQRQQQKQMLIELEHKSENSSQEQNNEEQILAGGNVISDDPCSILSQELSDEDLSVVNMLLAEEVGTELWTNEIYDKPTSAS